MPTLALADFRASAIVPDVRFSSPLYARLDGAYTAYAAQQEDEDDQLSRLTGSATLDTGLSQSSLPKGSRHRQVESTSDGT